MPQPLAYGPSPLDETHYHAMNQVLDIVSNALPILEKCKNCGLPVDVEIQTLKDRAQFAQSVKRNFFPEMP